MKKYWIFIACSVILTSCFNTSEEKMPDLKNIPSPIVKGTAEVVLWMEKEFDKEFGEEIDVIKINEKYFDTLPNAEKAIIAYYATFHGNECWWENDAPNETRSNLKCKLISALNLGYQCSDTHLDFLRQWFRTQPDLLAELEHCPTVPTTSTAQDSFEDMQVERKKDIFTLRFTVCLVNLRENLTRCYEETHTFRIHADFVEEIKTNLI